METGYTSTVGDKYFDALPPSLQVSGPYFANLPAYNKFPRYISATAFNIDDSTDTNAAAANVNGRKSTGAAVSHDEPSLRYPAMPCTPLIRVAL